LQMALLESASAAGATIVDAATVSAIRQSGSGMTVSTTSGNIGARAGIMAVDAMCWRRGFDPWWKRVMTVSLQTAPVAAINPFSRSNHIEIIRHVPRLVENQSLVRLFVDKIQSFDFQVWCFALLPSPCVSRPMLSSASHAMSLRSTNKTSLTMPI